ncbi:efflux RND transporter periplasmic adaptor subunit [Frigoriglobus tundricola]|uniref:Putative Co/Zn/Cd efflux system membrane fusion protein n=1 Tax=Frigoriglobus tundricola TaxID=2774151 RepID=A0A6M5Z070_9BACT|nr:efflux RND transporter periplasmic adaptor subunit [Frigoriglobus tundricola]QJW99548.1 putative Co/Zn/Cd efflux system membrane fusion protein [Frigoriglobus tundricola]
MSATTPPPAPAGHGHDPHDAPEAVPARPSSLRLAIIAVLTLGAVGALGVAGVRARNQQLAERTEAATAMHSDRPRVLTATAERAPARVEQVLPASAAPWRESPLYARTSGYLKGWKVDRGDVVTEGQLLAEIETPEVDAQLLQARATLAESRATLLRNKASAELARVNLDRLRQSYERGVSSRQDFDESDAALKVALATVQVSDATIQASEANVNRLETLQKFQKVTAPFAGVITARNYDSGALVIADSSGGREIFHIAAIDTLRVQADVPQTYATSVKVGQLAPVSRREVPGKEFPGTVGRTLQSVNVQTRTLRVEVDVPNHDHALLPGMYLQVRFQFEPQSAIVRVPGAAVVIRAEGAKVAVIDADGRVTYQVVKLGRDYGTVVEVTEGLKGGERLVVRPGDDLAPGTLVEPVAATDK